MAVPMRVPDNVTGPRRAVSRAVRLASDDVMPPKSQGIRDERRGKTDRAQRFVALWEEILASAATEHAFDACMAMCERMQRDFTQFALERGSLASRDAAVARLARHRA